MISVELTFSHSLRGRRQSTKRLATAQRWVCEDGNYAMVRASPLTCQSLASQFFQASPLRGMGILLLFK